MDISNVSNAAVWNRNTSQPSATDGDLKTTLRSIFPNLSIAIGELPEDQKELEKRAMAGTLAGLTIHPAAAERMQSDAAFRDKVIAGIKADQEANPVGKTFQAGNSTAEIVSHGTVVEKDGTINSWTLSQTKTTTGDDDDKVGGTKKKSLLEAIKDKLKELQEQNKLSKDTYDATMKQADEMRAEGKSEDEIAAKLRETYLAALSNGDKPSVGIETTA